MLGVIVKDVEQVVQFLYFLFLLLDDLVQVFIVQIYLEERGVFLKVEVEGVLSFSVKGLGRDFENFQMFYRELGWCGDSSGFCSLGWELVLFMMSCVVSFFFQ